MKIFISEKQIAVFCTVPNTVNVFCLEKAEIIFSRTMDFEVEWAVILRKTQYFALICHKKISFWDDANSEIFAQLHMASSVLKMEFQQHHVFILCEHAMFVYEFPSMKQIWRSEKNSPQTFLSLFYDLDSKKVVFPAFSKTKVQVLCLDTMQSHAISVSESMVVYAQICPEGQWLATASEKGTLIRIFDMETGEPLKELRRGLEQVTISSLCFSCDRTWLAVASQKGTTHIFALNSIMAEESVAKMSKSSELKTSLLKMQRRFTQEEEEKEEKNMQMHMSSMSLPMNKKSAFSFAENYLPSYFQSEWSFATFKLERFKGEILCIFPPLAPFQPKSLQKLIIINTTGHYWCTEFHIKYGGDCIVEKYTTLGF